MGRGIAALIMQNDEKLIKRCLLWFVFCVFLARARTNTTSHCLACCSCLAKMYERLSYYCYIDRAAYISFAARRRGSIVGGGRGATARSRRYEASASFAHAAYPT